MKLRTFNKDNMPGKVNTVACIYVEGKYGVLSLSAKANDAIGLKEGDCLEFLQDEDKPGDWFISIGKNGFPLRQKTGKYPQFVITNTTLARNVLASVKRPVNAEIKAATLRIIENPVDFEGRKLHLIITAEPLKTRV